MKQICITDKLKENKAELILLGGAVLFFLFMALYKLTDAPIWLDEAWEFYYSTVPSGQIPGVSLQNNMYERMITSYQPPLYNALLFIWLKFGESEWWFRFLGVVIGLISVGGLYKCIKKFCSYQIAALSIVIYSCVYQVIYYIQECAEYSVLLMFLMWTLYFYILVMEEASLKNIILFAVFCALCIYTQYGAVFVVLPLLGSLFLTILLDKNWGSLKKLTGVYLTTLAAAGGPLIIFFLLPQMNNPDPTYNWNSGLKFYNGNIFSDHLQMLMDVFRWNTIESMTRFYGLAFAACGSLILLGIYCMKFSKSKILKHLLVCNVITWLAYYALTRLEIYAYGFFGARYNIFFIPLWLVTILFLLWEVYRTTERIQDDKKKKIMQNLYRSVMVIMAVGYCVYGSHQILKHWEKADTRGCVQTWYEMEGYQTTTLVSWDQAKSFTYYLEHDDRYQESYVDNIYREMTATVTSADDFDMEYKQYEEYLDAIFGNSYPDELYYFVGDKERCQIFKVFEDKGYTADEVYRTTAGLYYVHK